MNNSAFTLLFILLAVTAPRAEAQNLLPGWRALAHLDSIRVFSGLSSHPDARPPDCLFVDEHVPSGVLAEIAERQARRPDLIKPLRLSAGIQRLTGDLISERIGLPIVPNRPDQTGSSGSAVHISIAEVPGSPDSLTYVLSLEVAQPATVGGQAFRLPTHTTTLRRASDGSDVCATWEAGIAALVDAFADARERAREWAQGDL